MKRSMTMTRMLMSATLLSGSRVMPMSILSAREPFRLFHRGQFAQVHVDPGKPGPKAAQHSRQQS
ncbi:hypothetical protein WS71_22415 [Burkholderia mayonis]|uniref:Secreted protein n=1 Tax=Burkholderia mayonis TaxID=1385591 RepID=A0A1B4G299_9BURK|nr:hypothetical protein WS71_22415 [Burkholderia mayonis]